MNNPPTPHMLRIYQQNLNKSPVAHADFIAKVNPKDWDLALIQEPYLDKYELTKVSKGWHVYYPSTKKFEGHPRLRTLILISRYIPSDSYQQIDVSSSDITALRIWNNSGSFSIFNIYNDCNHNLTLTALKEHIQPSLHYPSPTDHMLWFGDFNRHHLMWESLDNHHLNSSADLIEPLLELVIEHGMLMALPHGLHTLTANNGGRNTRPDNVWRTGNDSNPFVKCDVDYYNRPPKTDHYPIHSWLEFPLPRRQGEPFRRFREIDWEEFNEELSTQLNLRSDLKDTYLNTTELTAAVDALTSAITQTIEKLVPLSPPCEYAKRWWTRELTEIRRTKNRISRETFKWRGTLEHPSHTEYNKICDHYAKRILETKEDHWLTWLEDLNDQDIWNANKYVANPPSDLSCERIPPLKTAQNGLANTNEEKANVLSATFFPPPPTSSSLPEVFVPDPVGTFEPYSKSRLTAATQKLKPYKAPGPDGIPNVVLKECIDTLTEPLLAIFNSVFSLKFYPPQWKHSTTVVLRKPGKPAYNVPNAYRPIALLNTLPKLLSALVAEDLTYLSESKQLLPSTQFGGRPGRTTTDAIHLLVQKVKDAWRKGHVVSALFLDIQAAFPNVVKKVLLRNIRTKGVPEEYVRFLDNMLTERFTRLKFDDYISSEIPINNGNSQGCPLSMILYSFYIAPLLESARGNSEATIGFVDDTTLLATGRNFHQTHAILKEMMERPNGAIAWSMSHNSPLEMSKVALMDFTLSPYKAADSADLVLEHFDRMHQYQRTIIKATPAHKLLGVILDKKLRWTRQHEMVQAKATKWTALFKRLNRVSTGISLRFSRQLYMAVAIPRITYAADTWFVPSRTPTDAQSNIGAIGLTKKLASIQRQAAILITGALRTTAGDAAEVHADLFPINLLLMNHCYRAAARLATLPPTHPLHPYIKRTARHLIRRHRTPLHYLFHHTSINPTQVETIYPYRQDPNCKKKFKTHIAPSKKDAIRQELRDRDNEFMIYSDGSGFEDQIGAAAVLYRNGTPVKHLQYYLGPIEEHTVYEGELVGILLALHLLTSIQSRRQKVKINLDNQAAIISTLGNRSQPAHYLLDAINDTIDMLQKAERRRLENGRAAGSTPISLTLNWVPGHQGIPGNEEADAKAKEASSGISSNNNDLPELLRSPLPISATALRQNLRDTVKKRWRAQWANSHRATRLASIDRTLPSARFRKMVQGLSRAETSILTQLRTNHLPLNEYLHRTKKSNHPFCRYCQGENVENILHYVYICPAYARARTTLERKLGRNAHQLSYLLGNPKATKPLLEYIRQTNRFQTYLRRDEKKRNKQRAP
jgi:ribonuclease HI